MVEVGVRMVEVEVWMVEVGVRMVQDWSKDNWRLEFG